MNAVAELVGTYAVTSGEKAGEPIPPGRLAGTTVRFAEDKVTVTDGTKKETYVALYELDTKATPWRIVMTATVGPDTGGMASGLVEKDGDTVRLIYSLPGTQPPTEFKTKPGQLMFVLRSESEA